MTDKTEGFGKSQADREEHLRTLAHDLKNCLSVISMGMAALEAVREDAAQFADVQAAIKKDGVDPLKNGLSTLLALAAERQK